MPFKSLSCKKLKFVAKEGLSSKCLQGIYQNPGEKCVRAHYIPYTKINYILSKMIHVKERERRKKDGGRGEKGGRGGGRI